MRKMMRSLGALLIAIALGGIGAEMIMGATSPSAVFQFPESGWQAYAPAEIQCGRLLAANFNSTSDQPIYITVPSSSYMLDTISVSNASISLTTAAGGIYSAASKGGVALVANTQAYSTLTAPGNDASGSALNLTIATAGQNNQLDLNTMYFSLTTSQGAAATADVRVYCNPLY
jgi:hypothetical protein